MQGERASKAAARPRFAVASAALALDQIRKEAAAQAVARTAASLGKAEQHRVSSVNTAVAKTLEEAEERQADALARIRNSLADEAAAALAAAVAKAVRETKEKAAEEAAEVQRSHARAIDQLRQEAVKAQAAAVSAAVAEANQQAAKRQLQAIAAALERAKIEAEAEKQAAMAKALRQAAEAHAVAQAKAVAEAVEASVAEERVAGQRRQELAVRDALDQAKVEAEAAQVRAVEAAVARTLEEAKVAQEAAVAAAIQKTTDEVMLFHRRTIAIVSREAARSTVDRVKGEAHRLANAHAGKLAAGIAARAATAGALQMVPATISFLAAPSAPRLGRPYDRRSDRMAPTCAASAPNLHASACAAGADHVSSWTVVERSPGQPPGEARETAQAFCPNPPSQGLTDGPSTTHSLTPGPATNSVAVGLSDADLALTDDDLDAIVADASLSAERAASRFVHASRGLSTPSPRPSPSNAPCTSPGKHTAGGSLHGSSGVGTRLREASALVEGLMAVEATKTWDDAWASLRARTVNHVTQVVHRSPVGAQLGLPDWGAAGLPDWLPGGGAKATARALERVNSMRRARSACSFVQHMKTRQPSTLPSTLLSTAQHPSPQHRSDDVGKSPEVPVVVTPVGDETHASDAAAAAAQTSAPVKDAARASKGKSRDEKAKHARHQPWRSELHVFAARGGVRTAAMDGHVLAIGERRAPAVWNASEAAAAPDAARPRARAADAREAARPGSTAPRNARDTEIGPWTP